MNAILQTICLLVAWAFLLFLSRKSEKGEMITSRAGRALLFFCWLVLGILAGHFVGMLPHWENKQILALAGGGLIGFVRGLIAAGVIRRIWPDGYP